MILPKDLATESEELKQRDADILNTWLYEGMTQAELAVKYKMSPDNVYAIIRKNRSAIKLDKEYSKLKRIHELEYQLRKTGDTQKDKIEVLEQLRKEYDGDNGKTVITNTNFSLGEISSDRMREIITALRERVLQSRTA